MNGFEEPPLKSSGRPTPTATAPMGVGANASAKRAIQPLTGIPSGPNEPRTP